MSPTEQEQLPDTWRDVSDLLVIHDEDVDRVAKIWFALDDPTDTSQHPQLYAALKPCEDRFKAFDDEQDTFRKRLNQFVRMYAFLSQVLSYTDTQMEKRYACARMLHHRLRDQAEGALDLGDDIVMVYLKIEAGDTTDATLQEGGGELTAFTRTD